MPVSPPAGGRGFLEHRVVEPPHAEVSVRVADRHQLVEVGVDRGDPPGGGEVRARAIVRQAGAEEQAPVRRDRIGAGGRAPDRLDPDPSGVIEREVEEQVERARRRLDVHGRREPRRRARGALRVRIAAGIDGRAMARTPARCVPWFGRAAPAPEGNPGCTVCVARADLASRADGQPRRPPAGRTRRAVCTPGRLPVAPDTAARKAKANRCCTSF